MEGGRRPRRAVRRRPILHFFGTCNVVALLMQHGPPSPLLAGTITTISPDKTDGRHFITRPIGYSNRPPLRNPSTLFVCNDRPGREATRRNKGDNPNQRLMEISPPQATSVRLGMLHVTQVAKRGNLRALMSGRDNSSLLKMQPTMQK